MENDYINLHDESIRAISEELAKKSKGKTDSSYIVSSLNGDLNISERISVTEKELLSLMEIG